MQAEAVMLAAGPGRRAEAVIARVRRGSPAARVGVRAGDVLLAVDGLRPRDVIDLGYGTAGAQVVLTLRRGGAVREVRVERDGVDCGRDTTARGLATERERSEPQRARKHEAGDLGIDLMAPTLDGIRRCANRCPFCFIDGLPEGMRETLYIRDDDYRYSFLYGGFVTLTNLRPEDEARICYQRLSPLRVSVHATDLAVRRRLLANPRAPDILEQLDRLGAAGIEFHAQVVLVPGLNDGPVLTRTIADLAARYPSVRSVAVVPVGLTRHSHTVGLRTLDRADAAAALAECRSWQRRLRPRLGVRFVYPSDELYLLAGEAFPPPSHYDDYPQLQNGVGLVPLFLTEWRRVRRRLPAAVPPRRVLWVCGQAMERALGLVAEEMRTVEGLAIEVVAVPNAFFGTSVTVSGLLTGADVARALAGREADRVVLPRAMFDAAGERTLDDWTRAELAARLPGTVYVARTAGELLEATCAA
jgi:putative radical SAM enzyme (TIGR03279 family)